MEDKAALTHCSAESKLTVTQDSVQLAPLAMMIDQTTFKGSLTLNAFRSSTAEF